MSKYPSKARFVLLGLGMLFLLFGGLQWNDLDLCLWIITYGVCALYLLLGAGFGAFPITLSLIALACLLFPGLWSLNGVQENIAKEGFQFFGPESLSEEKPWVEQTREFVGCLLLFGSISFLLILEVRRRFFRLIPHG